MIFHIHTSYRLPSVYQQTTVQRFSTRYRQSRNLMNSKRENFLRISFLPFAKSTATLWVKVGFPIPGLPTLEFVYGWDDLRHLQILHCCLPAFFSLSRQVSCGLVKTLTVCKCHECVPCCLGPMVLFSLDTWY